MTRGPFDKNDLILAKKYDKEKGKVAQYFIQNRCEIKVSTLFDCLDLNYTTLRRGYDLSARCNEFSQKTDTEIAKILNNPMEKEGTLTYGNVIRDFDIAMDDMQFMYDAWQYMIQNWRSLADGVII